MHLHTGLTTAQFVGCSLVGILEPAPAADIINDQYGEVAKSAFHIVQELLQSKSATDVEATFAFVGV